MVVLGEAEGADSRLVASFRYSRVLLVALAAASSRALGGTSNAPHDQRALANTNTLGQSRRSYFSSLLSVSNFARLLRLQAWAVLGQCCCYQPLHSGRLAPPLNCHGGFCCGVRTSRLAYRLGIPPRYLTPRKASPAYGGRASLSLMVLCALLAWYWRACPTSTRSRISRTSPEGGLGRHHRRLDTARRSAVGNRMQSVRLLLLIGLAPSIARLVVRYRRI